MLNIKQIVFPLLTFAFFSYPAQTLALGQKPVRDASYYVQELNVIPQNSSDYDLPVPETKLLAKCGESKGSADDVGIVVTDKGEAFGYSGKESLDRFKTKVLLLKNKDDIDKILKYAQEIALEKQTFDFFPESASICGLDYLKEFRVYKTRWAKHPYLRETNPPPEELILLFEAVNNVVKKVPVFPEGMEIPGITTAQEAEQSAPEAVSSKDRNEAAASALPAQNRDTAPAADSL